MRETRIASTDDVTLLGSTMGRLADADGSAPVMAVSIFLNALNVFLFFLQIFNGRD